MAGQWKFRAVSRFCPNAFPPNPLTLFPHLLAPAVHGPGEYVGLPIRRTATKFWDRQGTGTAATAPPPSIATPGCPVAHLLRM